MPPSKKKTMLDVAREMAKGLYDAGIIDAATEKSLCAAPLIPKKETIAAMKEVRQKKLRSFKNIDELMDDLNAPG